ncbi:MAG: glycosyltransferase family 8 protein [Peptococcaceae bacterium]|nr:glycosyltransferase family 8 protein [Peptococcaceae bacterium]MBP3626046.1 glycosyltransferase family 8 protein [Peptococcaceae bacterium]
MNLLFSIDQNCSTLLLNCMNSITKNGGAEQYDAYILHSDLHIDLQNKITLLAPDVFRCHFIEVPNELFTGFPETKRYPKQIYYRLAASELLPEPLDRVLYLDVDTLVINSLTELYDADFEGNLFMACTHMNKLLEKVNQVRLDVEKHVPYINTGVLLMNLPLMRAEVSLQQIQAYAAQKKEVLLLPDQDILTALYGNRVKLIDALKYNLSDRDIMWHNADPNKEKIDLKWVENNAVILHYYGRNKPWKDNYKGILGVFYTEQEEIKCAIG